MPPLEHSKSTIEYFQYSNIAGVQKEDLKQAMIIEPLKEEMNKSYKEIQENTQKILQGKE